MKRARILFGLLALVPAAVNASPAAASSIFVPLCTGDGVVRTVEVPLGHSGLPGREQPGCCAKGCHSGSNRKRCHGRVDSAQ